MVDLNGEKILICFLLIVLGYCIAKMFSRSCNGFSVSGGNEPFLHKVNRYVMGTFGLRGSWH